MNIIEFLKKYNLSKKVFYGKKKVERLNLSELKDFSEIPDGFNPKADRLYLNGLETIPADFNPKVNILFLNQVKEIPIDFNPRHVKTLYLEGVLRLNHFFDPSLSELYLNSVVELPKNYCPQNIQMLYVLSLTKFPKGFSPKLLSLGLGKGFDMSQFVALPNVTHYEFNEIENFPDALPPEIKQVCLHNMPNFNPNFSFSGKRICMDKTHHLPSMKNVQSDEMYLDRIYQLPSPFVAKAKKIKLNHLQVLPEIFNVKSKEIYLNKIKVLPENFRLKSNKMELKKVFRIEKNVYLFSRSDLHLENVAFIYENFKPVLADGNLYFDKLVLLEPGFSPKLRNGKIFYKGKEISVNKLQKKLNKKPYPKDESNASSKKNKKIKQLFLAIFFGDLEKVIAFKNDYPDLYAQKERFLIDENNTFDLTFLTLFHHVIWFDEAWTKIPPYVSKNREKTLLMLDFWQAELGEDITKRTFNYNDYSDFFYCMDPSDYDEVFLESKSDYLAKGFREIDLMLYNRAERFDFVATENLLKQGANCQVDLEPDETCTIMDRILSECTFLDTCVITPLFEDFENEGYNQKFDITGMFRDLLGYAAHEKMYHLLLSYYKED